MNGPHGEASDSRGIRAFVGASDFVRTPVAALLEYTGLLIPSAGSASASVSSPSVSVSCVYGEGEDTGASSVTSGSTVSRSDDQEVAIRIIGDRESSSIDGDLISDQITQLAASSSVSSTDNPQEPGGDCVTDDRSSRRNEEAISANSFPSTSSGSFSTYQRYDIQSFARWVEQILPFSFLLILVFVRQHLQGFCVALWITAVLYKSNEVIRRQTALKLERKISFLLLVIFVSFVHIAAIYWRYVDEGLLRPLVLFPPKSIPPFWHAVFNVIINDAMVRLLGMALKCIVLLFYKNNASKKFRKQGQLLSLIEYVLLVYRAMLPTPVWYRFFLNKEYGNFFSSLVAGLYLTFKLASILSKVQLLAAFRALSSQDIRYGSYATAEQVNAAGDHCAICQEKMESPILLHCKHIFCEECVSEWLERERTCPLCRALVNPTGLRSYSDGSTSLLFQLF